MLKLKLIAVVQSVVIILLLIMVVLLLLRQKNSASSVSAGKKQAALPVSIKITEEDGVSADGTAAGERYLYPVTGEKIFLREGGYGEIWLPVLANVPADTHNKENFITRNGLTCYVEDQEVTSCIGVDVSSHQEEIDWTAVHDSGVKFAMIRCGFRGYGSGELAVDPYFDKNVQGALDAGLEVGVYFYSQAVTPEEAAEEAEMTIALIGDSRITYPVVYDWELVTNDKARTDNIPVDTLTECTRTFCDAVRDAGFIPMVYQNKYTSLLKLDLPMLTDYDFWLAEYNDAVTYYYDYQIWQYTSSGSIPGIKGEVDMNICFHDYAQT